MESSGGWGIYENSALGRSLKRYLDELLDYYGDQGLMKIYQEQGVYNFYLQNVHPTEGKGSSPKPINKFGQGFKGVRVKGSGSSATMTQKGTFSSTGNHVYWNGKGRSFSWPIPVESTTTPPSILWEHTRRENQRTIRGGRKRDTNITTR